MNSKNKLGQTISESLRSLKLSLNKYTHSRVKRGLTCSKKQTSSYTSNYGADAKQYGSQDFEVDEMGLHKNNYTSIQFPPTDHEGEVENSKL